ncbi:MAG: substrate-binding domain-containing protein [Caldimonas sp.]
MKLLTSFAQTIPAQACLSMLIALCGGGCAVSATHAGDALASSRRDSTVFPPWQKGANNPSSTKGVELTVFEADNLADFHGDLSHAELVLYVAGNSFFAMAPLTKAFESAYPAYKGKVYFETLPPGILAKQLANGGTITVGNMTWTVKPDAYLAGLAGIRTLIDHGTLVGPLVSYATNDLAIMVAAGNPKHITGLTDLARPDVRLALPNLVTEGVSRQIQTSLVKAGGDELRSTVYEGKVKAGTSLITQVHHRQTPVWIMQDKVDAGVLWQSEVVFQRQVGHPIEAVVIPASQNTVASYSAAAVANSAHPKAAQDWLSFIQTPEALTVLQGYGFKAVQSKPGVGVNP